MNDVRPIDANALKVRMVRSREFNSDTCSFDLPVVPWHDIEDAETLDYAPVRHGEWIEKIEPYAYTAAGREIHIFHCSACDFTWANRRMVFEYFKYCPNCGAKMDGGKKDG